MIVTIRGVKQVNIAKEDAEPAYKWAIKFSEFDKPMILNATNSKTLRSLTNSPFIEDWAGFKVSIYVDTNVMCGNTGVYIDIISRKPGIVQSHLHIKIADIIRG